jgi:uncharacterized protein (DUF1778 family)
MPKQTRTTKPLSVRFTDEERAVLRDAAGNLSVSAYVRDSALKAAGERMRRRKASYDPSETRTQLAQVLALLGKSRASGALREILDLARLGALPVTPELEAKIDAACTDIAEIKTLLMAALGLKAD